VSCLHYLPDLISAQRPGNGGQPTLYVRRHGEFFAIKKWDSSHQNTVGLVQNLWNTRSVGEPHMGCFLIVDFNRLVLGGKEKWPLPPKFYGTVVLGTKYVQICFQYLDSAPARNYDQSWDNLSDSIIYKY
jgi:hypothetical protein